MIYVFQTNVETEAKILQLKPNLDKLIPHGKWNFDQEDCDNILRIDSKETPVFKIIDLLKTQNFDCEELK